MSQKSAKRIRRLEGRVDAWERAVSASRLEETLTLTQQRNDERRRAREAERAAAIYRTLTNLGLVVAVLALTVAIILAAKMKAPETSPAPAPEPAGQTAVRTIQATEVQFKPLLEPSKVTYYEPPWDFYTDTELGELALIIYQEAGGDACSDETRQMVGEVVLNRVKDSRFPDFLSEVLLQEGQYGRLHWTGLVWPERAELPEEEHAVRRAFECAEKLLNRKAAQLLPNDAVWQAEFPQGAETVAYQDGIYFCR